MRTVFLGTSDFAAAVLDQLAASARHRPALVVTRPDRPSGRGRRITSPPVADRARELKIPLVQPASVNDVRARERIAQAEPVVVVVCAFGALIKEPLLSQHELLNVHPSLLPRWRGAAPIERALMARDASTGVSLMRVTQGLDSGPVTAVASEAVEPSDTYGTLSSRLRQAGGQLLVRTLDRREEGKPLPFIEQLEEDATYAEKISAADRMLDPERPASELEARVRALSPHIGARVALPDATLLGVKQARLRDGAGPAAPMADVKGVQASDGRLLLACTPGLLELLVVQPPGGRPMDAASYLRGHGLPGRR
ncbi:MAG: methionyl-tRNA formyltransferase [Actinobacteria bacterium]|nr:MAG: methionyl-tRNA formyltransferase [Actinomycetota bacterium]